MIVVSAPKNSFTYVSCPTTRGFQKTSIESFVGVATIKAYSRKNVFEAYNEIETVELNRVAMEFGGDAAECLMRL